MVIGKLDNKTKKTNSLFLMLISLKSDAMREVNPVIEFKTFLRPLFNREKTCIKKFEEGLILFKMIPP